MSLGAALLMPQRLDRLDAMRGDQAFGDDLVALLQQLLTNPRYAQALAPVLGGAFTRAGERLAARMQARLPEALSQASALMAPLTDTLQELAARAGEVETPLDGLALIEGMLDATLAAVQGLSEASLRRWTRAVHALLTGPLGLSQEALQAQLRLICADVRAELLRGSAALAADQAAVHQALAAVLGRVETEVLEGVPALDWQPDRVAQELHRTLRAAGLQKVRAQLACIVEKAKATLGATEALAGLAGAGPFGPGSVGAAQPNPPLSGDRYCWYASWLYASKRRLAGDDFSIWLADKILPGYPYDRVWLSADGTQLMLRRVGDGNDEVLHTFAEGAGQWHQAPQFAGGLGPEVYSFGVVGPQFLEVWTQVFAALVEAGKTAGHITAFATSPREKGANVPLTFWNFIKLLTVPTGKAPLQALLTNLSGWGVGSEYLYIWVPWLIVLLGGLEGKHTETNGVNIFAQYATLLGGDALSAYNIHSLISGAHGLLLSLWTLLNQTGPAGATGDPDTRPDNREHGGPVVSLGAVLANMLMIKLVPREDYAHPFHPDNPAFYGYWFLGAGMGIAGATLGTLATWALSRTYDAGQLGENIGAGALVGFIGFLLQWYTTKEGDTADGTYNPKKDPEGNAYSPARLDFTGYPAADTSPYKLPYAKGTALFVGQANQGMFSHMRFNWVPQVYAYDFAHDFGDEVLASRAGTVVDYFDWLPDDTDPADAQIWDAIKTALGWAGPGEPTQADVNTAAATPASGLIPGQTGVANIGYDTGGNFDQAYFNWNFIVVRHDTVVAAHDTDILDPSLRATFPCTYAVYGHGKRGSVREVFAAKGVTDPRDIIGQTVQQGEVLMHAGDVGTSFHNHLHMHVLGGPAPAAVPPPVSSGLSRFTLPFVFREATHVLGRDGVLRYLTWYTSDNQRVG